jgi:hypothetical protein
MSDSLLYTEADRAAVAAEHRKRLAVTLVPSCLLILLAAAVFVWFRLRHDVSGWVWSALLTLVGGAYALFFGGTYLRPVSQYLKHIGYMLDGQRREAVGVITHVEKVPQDKDGLDCYAFTLNIGKAADPKDDRLFYFDALKGPPPFANGDRLRVSSNDGKVAGLERIREEP